MPVAAPAQPVILLYGAADTLLRQSLDALVAERVDPADQYAVKLLWADETPLEDLLTELSAFSLMATRRVVILRNVDRYSAEEQERLAAALVRLAEGLTLLLTAGAGERGQPPVAAALRAALKQHGQVMEFAPPAARALPDWLLQQATARGLKMTRAVAEHFAEHAASDLDMLGHELDKLVLYLGERDRVEPADILAVVTASDEATSFQLVDALGQRQAGRALEALDAIVPPSASAREEFLPLLGMMARQFRLIWQARALPTDSVGMEDMKPLLPEQHNFLRETGGRDWLARKYRTQARNFTDAQLARALLLLYEADRTLKGRGARKLNDRAAVELLIVDLCNL